MSESEELRSPKHQNHLITTFFEGGTYSRTEGESSLKNKNHCFIHLASGFGGNLTRPVALEDSQFPNFRRRFKRMGWTRHARSRLGAKRLYWAALYGDLCPISPQNDGRNRTSGLWGFMLIWGQHMAKNFSREPPWE